MYSLWDLLASVSLPHAGLAGGLIIAQGAIVEEIQILDSFVLLAI